MSTGILNVGLGAAGNQKSISSSKCCIEEGEGLLVGLGWSYVVRHFNCGFKGSRKSISSSECCSEEGKGLMVGMCFFCHETF